MSPVHSDPLEAVGPLSAALVLSFLEPRELARCGVVSRSWRQAALLDERLWQPHVTALWEDKVHVPDSLRELARVSPRRAFVDSLAEPGRQLPTEEELCRFTWALQFKAVSWFSASLGSLTVRRYFNPNHTITAPPSDPLWGDREPQRHYWWFRPGPNGAQVIQVNTYPYLTCRRTADWGWELQNGIVRLSIDAAAGPNPGLPPDHPAAREALTVAQIEARFNSILLLEMLEGLGEEDDTDEEETEEGQGGQETDEEESGQGQEHEDGQGSQQQEHEQAGQDYEGQ